MRKIILLLIFITGCSIAYSVELNTLPPRSHAANITTGNSEYAPLFKGDRLRTASIILLTTGTTTASLAIPAFIGLTNDLRFIESYKASITAGAAVLITLGLLLDVGGIISLVFSIRYYTLYKKGTVLYKPLLGIQGHSLKCGLRVLL